MIDHDTNPRDPARGVATLLASTISALKNVQPVGRSVDSLRQVTARPAARLAAGAILILYYGASRAERKVPYGGHRFAKQLAP